MARECFECGGVFFQSVCVLVGVVLLIWNLIVVIMEDVMKNLKIAVGWLVGIALVCVIGLFYVTMPYFGVDVTLMKSATVLLLSTLAASVVGLIAVKTVLDSKRKSFVRKNTEFLLEECYSKIMFRTYFEILCGKYVLTQDEFAPLIEECVNNAWLYLARDVVERAGRKLNRNELNLVMLRAEKEGRLDIAQDASDMRYELSFGCSPELLVVGLVN